MHLNIHWNELRYTEVIDLQLTISMKKISISGDIILSNVLVFLKVVMLHIKLKRHMQLFLMRTFPVSGNMLSRWSPVFSPFTDSEWINTAFR